MVTSLDVLSFAVPYPPNYGGVIDVYYRLKAMADAGLKIRLHCFTYDDRGPMPELNAVCDEVFYYPRSSSIWHHMGREPYIVSTRQDDLLVSRLAKHTDPILFEGLHTCAHITDASIAHRKKIVRMHNVESQYYNHLASENRGWRRVYFRRESRKLQDYEGHVLSSSDLILAISEAERAYFAALHENVMLLPAGHPFSEVSIRTGLGDYVLLQGDLSLRHNLSILPMLAPACATLNIRLIVAGKAPMRAGRQFIGNWENIELHTDVSHDSMMNLMLNAQIHVVDGANPAGFKLKLLSSLFAGRHVIARKRLVGDELVGIVRPFETAIELSAGIESLMKEEVDVEAIEHRKSVLLPRFSNILNANKLVDRLKSSL